MKVQPELVDDLDARLRSFTQIKIPVAFLNGGVNSTTKGDYKFSMLVPAEYYEDVLKLMKVRGIPLCVTVDRWEENTEVTPTPQTKTERHMEHYRSCECLGDSAVCCDLNCCPR